MVNRFLQQRKVHEIRESFWADEVFLESSRAQETILAVEGVEKFFIKKMGVMTLHYRILKSVAHCLIWPQLMAISRCLTNNRRH